MPQVDGFRSQGFKLGVAAAVGSVVTLGVMMALGGLRTVDTAALPSPQLANGTLVVDANLARQARALGIDVKEQERSPESGQSVGFPTAEALGDALADSAESILDHAIEFGAISRPANLTDPLLLEGRAVVLSSEVNQLTASDVIAKLLYLDTKSSTLPIDLYIRTDGGWASDAMAIVDTMQSISAPVNTWALGKCSSAGSRILVGGTGKRRALPDSLVMLHLTHDDGGEEFSKTRVERLATERFWKKRTKLPDSFYPMTGDQSLYLNAEKLLEYGVIDEIYRRK